MEPEDNMAPGQQHFPKEGELGNQDAQNGQDIIKGARQDDQLKEMRETAAEEPASNEHGAQPNAYQYERKIGDDQQIQSDEN